MISIIKGIILGFSIAAPVGPIGVICIRRTIVLGRLHGFLSGLGAATADAIYGIIAGFGLSLIMNFLNDQKLILQTVGGLFLLYLGIKTFRSTPASKSTNAKSENFFGSYISTLMLTLTNPITIISFLGFFTGFGIVNSQGALLSAIALVIGVFLGSSLWWIVLCSVVGILKDRLETRSLKWINRLSGTIVFLFGLTSLLRVYKN